MPRLARFNPLRFCEPPGRLGQSPPPRSREALVAENAYFRAERRGFAPGHELEDWLAAEAEVGERSDPESPVHLPPGS